MFSRRSMLGGVAAGIAGIAMRPSPALAAAAAAVQDVDGAVRGALESYFSAQAKLTTWRNTEASGALTKSVIRSAAQFALQREDALRSDAAHVHQINGGYSSGRSVVEVHFVRERSASRMVIHLSDLGFYRHESIVDPLYPYAEFRTLYDVVLVTVAGVWTISEVIPIRHVRPLMIAPTVLESDPFIDRANLQSMLPGQTTSAAPAAESTDPEPDPDLPPSSDLPPASDESPAPNDKVLSAYDPQYSYQGVGGYNYGAMAAYANTYALSYNPNYPSWGADCTNFISQCMRAGGWAQITAGYLDRSNYIYWWVTGQFTSSYSWSGAQAWRNFAWYRKRFTPLSSIYSCSQGDVIGWDDDHDGSLNHVNFCQSNNGGDPLMAQHITDYKNVRLSTIVNKNTTNKQSTKYAHRT